MKLFLLFLLVGVGIAADLNDITVKIERHFPCSASSGPPKDSLRIKFPSYKSEGVQFTEEQSANGNKCFRMSGGKVEVLPPGLDGSKKYYVHVETRIGIKGKPERCINADKDGCGGIGSCVHCDICKQKGGSLRNFIQIFQKDKPAECSAEGLPEGTYDDLSLKVCLPNKEEMMKFLDPDVKRAKQIWNIFMQTRSQAGNIPLVIAARLFDRPINQLSTKDLNDALHGAKEGMIGCHWIYATISSQ
ncbi:unnamed protein product [Bursaphelenchus xylophilus]|uniref:(pine wood nematode) hypothetical protein n=1 Tax=Bursaphelenchus xylophilus TaxID=6326 RepID=A0A1I7RK53_BURXY|nr:unnamed protein product [Bursaphelenchus xylophilus]CAG9131501.1 unnamed protein product [Bursaphelenchus xylophilus]